MFGFRTVFCVLCEHRVLKCDAIALDGQRDLGVCRRCRAKWRLTGALCSRCKASVHGDRNLGIFMDRYALGHRGCGAAPLAAELAARA
jgi:predicted amidophosphoribosyltransferase